MIVGISRISGTPSSQITQQWQESVQNRPDLINNPNILNPKPATQGVGQGGNAPNTPFTPSDSFQNSGQNAIGGFQQESLQPTHELTLWGEKYVGIEGQAPENFVRVDGKSSPSGDVTAGGYTENMVMEHEIAHHDGAKKAKSPLLEIPTGPPVVTFGSGGLPDGGHVELRGIQAFDPQRALQEGMAYVNSYQTTMVDGLKKSAEAPQNHAPIRGTPFAELSDPDKNIANMAVQNGITKDYWLNSKEGQLIKAQAEANGAKGELTPQQKEMNAHLASHPDLMQAYLNGNLS